MINGQKSSVNDVVPFPEELPSRQLNAAQGSSLEGSPDDAFTSGPRRPIGRIMGFSLLGISLIAGLLLALHAVSVNKQQAALNADQSDQSAQIKSQSIGLSSLGLKPISLLAGTSNALTVNGSVNVADSLILDPIPTPTSAVAGQMYFDQQKNQLGYYTGSGFEYLQGGSNTSVTNYAVTNVTNNTVTNVTDATTTTGSSPSSSTTNITGTTGDIAMFTGANMLGDSMITEVGSALSVGTAGGSTTTALQGGTGGVSVITGGATGTSGSVDIASGASSTTSAGNVTVDTGSSFIPGVVTGAMTFEDNTTDGLAAWFCDDISPTNTQAHSGLYSLEVTEIPGCGGNWGVIQNGNVSTFAATAGHHIVVSFWAKAATTSRQIGGQIDWNGPNGSTPLTTVTDTSTGWTESITSVTVPVGSTSFIIDFGTTSAPNETHYFDDFTVTDLSSSATTAFLNLGSAYAQAVNLGNMNELAATTIDGGSGITLNAGSGSLDETAGAVNVSGSAASSFSTTNGSLTFESGGGGSGGGVIVKPQADTTTAFQVQNSSGSSILLDVDTSNSAVNLATSGGGSVNIGTTTGIVGFNGVGQIQDSGDNNLIAGGQYTAPITGSLGSVSIYIGNNVESAPDNLMQMAIYADNGSNAPGSYVASTAVDTVTANSWVTLPISASVTAGTKYWLVAWTNATNSYDNDPTYTTLLSQTHNYAYTTGVTFGSGPDNGMPATFPGPTADNPEHNFMSYYATYAGSIGTAINIDSTGTLNDYGAAVFKDATSSVTAFQIQNPIGTAIFSADTIDNIISVTNLVSNGDITVGGHIIGGGNPPTIVAGAAACTSPTVSISGTDTAGTITVTTGTGCTSGGDLADISFNSAFNVAPHISLTPGSSTALTLGGYVNDATVANTGFSIGTNSTPANTTTYLWNYQAIQ